MLFPFIVNDIEQHTFLELAYCLFAMTLGSRLEVNGDVIHFFTVGDRDEDVFVHLSLGLIDILDLRIRDLHQFVHTAFEAIECGLSQLFTQHIAFAMMEGIFIERHLNREGLHHIVFQPFVVAYRTSLIENILRRLVDHIRDIDTYTLTHEGVATLRIDQVTLLVHDIIVLDQAFTDTEVILLDLLLRALNRVGDHVMLNHLALLEAHTIHDRRYTFRTEHTHQVIFEGYVEDGTTRVSLTTGTTT